MTTTKRPFLQRISGWGFIALILLAILVVPLTSNRPQTGATLVYAILVTAFLLAQLVGFILSQTFYSDKVEEIKFDILREEEKEWRNFER